MISSFSDYLSRLKFKPLPSPLLLTNIKSVTGMAEHTLNWGGGGGGIGAYKQAPEALICRIFVKVKLFSHLIGSYLSLIVGEQMYRSRH